MEDESVASEIVPDEGQTVDEGVEQSQEVPQDGETSQSEVSDPQGQSVSLDEFNSLKDQYANLERKLGNYKEVEQKAQMYDQLQQGQEPQGDYISQLEQKYPGVDRESLQLVRDIVRNELDEFSGERLEPLAQDYYGRQAQQAIEKVREQYPDFDKYRDAIADRLSRTPDAVINEESIVDAYKILRFNDSVKIGEKKAYEKLQKKTLGSVATKDTSSANVTETSPKRGIWARFEEAKSEAIN